ncbi:uncharacterized protein [Dendropsophus ebraccatus]|uniref:uncharacterized protein isoform X2 n=1 Tax=Dendropsophus ebraccatus TaxID=150705 RepID=UPI0038313761
MAKSSDSDGGHTTERLAYKLTECITIVDNRGYTTIKDEENGQIYAQLGNFLPLNQKVTWEKDFVSIMSKVEDSDKEPNYSDFIVPIFVCSVKKTMTDEESLLLKTLFRNCRDLTGVYPIVVLTHKSSNPSYSHLDVIFKGAGAEQIHAVENYTLQDTMKTRGRCHDLLAVIGNALDDVKFRMNQPRNPVEERIDRKKFLMKFAYEFTVAQKLREVALAYELKTAQKLKEAAQEYERKIVERERDATKKENQRLRAAASKMWFGRFPD